MLQPAASIMGAVLLQKERRRDAVAGEVPGFFGVPKVHQQVCFRDLSRLNHELNFVFSAPFPPPDQLQPVVIFFQIYLVDRFGQHAQFEGIERAFWILEGGEGQLHLNAAIAVFGHLDGNRHLLQRRFFVERNRRDINGSARGHAAQQTEKNNEGEFHTEKTPSRSFP